MNCRAMKIDRDESRAHLRPAVEKNRLAKVASCILVRDCDDNVLLIRRRGDIKLYPSAWVCPGGHVDPDESIETAGVRELAEEAGVTLQQRTDGYFLDDKKVEVQPLVIYETANPQPDDSVRSQHIIIFFTIKLPKHHSEIPITLQRGEVNAHLWMSQDNFNKIIIHEDTSGTTPISILTGTQYHQTDLPNQCLSVYRGSEGIGYAHVFAIKHFFGY
eukprot:CAMPEP_0114978576 /NCGR_PEP_ID=MMETSP0216-20121206/3885_1 /TAXON_ID=223996 /ORGANISM="Protocruzia adherens, Strain Boccale" /LENGTH=216 /DNA_ID=CAMNT_0002339791 /DNA_START=562 /DNA_END=1212 /DNA_ORIENTATION=-